MSAFDPWAAIRKTDGEEWIDLNSIEWLRDETEKNVAEFDRTHPNWAIDNPVVRISRVRVAEDSLVKLGGAQPVSTS